MRKGWLSSVATALVGAGSALAQNPYYLPTNGAYPAGQNGVPALLSANPAQAPAPTSAAPPAIGGGSTGLVPGVDCLPASVPERAKLYGDVEYMLMWVKKTANPGALAIVAPAGAPLFGPGTAAVLGGQETDINGQSGVRATVGYWFGCDAKIGFEASGFIVERGDQGGAITSNGSATNPVLARPFLNASVVPAVPGAIFVGGPGITGAIAERQTVSLWGAEANGVLNWSEDCHRRTDLLAGFSYTDLRETLGVTSNSTAAGGTTLFLDDAVNTRNQFYAGQVGARSTWTYGKLSLVMTGQIALGVNHETADRFGTTRISAPGVAPVTLNTGFLAQASNSGHANRDQFAVGLPSQIMVGYQVTDNINAFVGYDFVYISSAARPGDQVDLTFQTNAAGTAIRPSPVIHQQEFWANSVLAGVAFKF